MPPNSPSEHPDTEARAPASTHEWHLLTRAATRRYVEPDMRHAETGIDPFTAWHDRVRDQHGPPKSIRCDDEPPPAPGRARTLDRYRITHHRHSTRHPRNGSVDMPDRGDPSHRSRRMGDHTLSRQRRISQQQGRTVSQPPGADQRVPVG